MKTKQYMVLYFYRTVGIQNTHRGSTDNILIKPFLIHEMCGRKCVTYHAVKKIFANTDIVEVLLPPVKNPPSSERSFMFRNVEHGWRLRRVW